MMFDKVNVPVLGVIENMAYFICDGCDKKHMIFGQAGATALEERFDIFVEDDEIEADIFATVGSLADFVREKIEA